jgi:acyl carrier protein
MLKMADKISIENLILKVAEIMINELKLEDVTPETFDPDLDLVDELGIDSMELATVALLLQDEYAIAIDEDDYPTLTNIRLIAEYIQERLGS